MNCESILSLFLPRRCIICDKRLTTNEDILCMGCLTTLAHPTLLDIQDNEAVRQLWGILPVHSGITLLYYKKGSEQHKLLEAMKYKGRVDACQKMGQLLASTMSPSGFFTPIDAIIPIPLSKKRQRWRGYNQAEHIALGISKFTGIEICTKAIIRKKDNNSQTRMSYTERMENVKGIFMAQKDARLDGKHLLIVDDILTTGATLRSAIETLHEAFPNATFSIATIALTAE